jgi:hypothetical protein
MSLLLRLRELYASVATTVRPMTAEFVDDLPEKLHHHHVYLVGEDNMPWSVGMLCPCRCGEVIRLSLVLKDRPRWRAEVLENGTVTLHPSIWRIKGCFSHFILRRGRVLWAQRGRPPNAAVRGQTSRTMPAKKDR